MLGIVELKGDIMKAKKDAFKIIMGFVYPFLAGMFVTLGLIFDSYDRIEMFGICMVLAIIMTHFWVHD